MPENINGEYLAVHMVNPANVGDRFTMWPLHMTLLPWFAAPDADIVKQKLEPVLQEVSPFEVMVGARDYLGRNHDVPVRLVQNTPQLQDLHEKLLQTVEANGWELKGRYTGEHYIPHVTQKAGQDASGTLQVDSVYIVERQSQGYREVVGSIDL